MAVYQQNLIQDTISSLYKDSENDYLKIMKGATMRLFRAVKPSDFEEAYLAISKNQGEYLKTLIINNNIKNIIEFGTSFGISTLFLAQAIIETKGHIITTELIESKAKKAIHNFRKAGVEELIEVRIGDAMQTLKNHTKPVDLLLLDGWKNLYLPLFRMLEPQFHSKTFIYVDNADMHETKLFMKEIEKENKYNFQSNSGGKAVLITVK